MLNLFYERVLFIWLMVLFTPIAIVGVGSYLEASYTWWYLRDRNIKFYKDITTIVRMILSIFASLVVFSFYGLFVILTYKTLWR